MKNKIITVALILIGVAGLMWWGKSAQLTNNRKMENKQQLNNSGTLIVNESVYDFGTISMKDGIVTKIFKLTNPTKEDIYLKNIGTSCGCTTAFIINGDSKKGPFGMEGMSNNRTNEIIPAGESRDIEVVYDPNAHGPAGVGIIDRFIYIIDVKGNETKLEIKAVVRP